MTPGHAKLSPRHERLGVRPQGTRRVSRPKLVAGDWVSIVILTVRLGSAAPSRTLVPADVRSAFDAGGIGSPRATALEISSPRSDGELCLHHLEAGHWRGDGLADRMTESGRTGSVTSIRSTATISRRKSARDLVRSTPRVEVEPTESGREMKSTADRTSPPGLRVASTTAPRQKIPPIHRHPPPFPPPVRLGPRAVAWRWSGLDRWTQLGRDTAQHCLLRSRLGPGRAQPGASAPLTRHAAHPRSGSPAGGCSDSCLASPSGGEDGPSGGRGAGWAGRSVQRLRSGSGFARWGCGPGARVCIGLRRPMPSSSRCACCSGGLYRTPGNQRAQLTMDWLSWRSATPSDEASALAISHQAWAASRRERVSFTDSSSPSRGPTMRPSSLALRCQRRSVRRLPMPLVIDARKSPARLASLPREVP